VRSVDSNQMSLLNTSCSFLVFTKENKKELDLPILEVPNLNEIERRGPRLVDLIDTAACSLSGTLESPPFQP
jgi:hypothetical protein